MIELYEIISIVCPYLSFITVSSLRNTCKLIRKKIPNRFIDIDLIIKEEMIRLGYNDKLFDLIKERKLSIGGYFLNDCLNGLKGDNVLTFIVSDFYNDKEHHNWRYELQTMVLLSHLSDPFNIYKDKFRVIHQIDKIIELVDITATTIIDNRSTTFEMSEWRITTTTVNKKYGGVFDIAYQLCLPMIYDHNGLHLKND